MLSLIINKNYMHVLMEYNNFIFTMKQSSIISPFSALMISWEGEKRVLK